MTKRQKWLLRWLALGLLAGLTVQHFLTRRFGAAYPLVQMPVFAARTRMHLRDRLTLEVCTVRITDAEGRNALAPLAAFLAGAPREQHDAIASGSFRGSAGAAEPPRTIAPSAELAAWLRRRAATRIPGEPVALEFIWRKQALTPNDGQLTAGAAEETSRCRVLLRQERTP